MTLSFFNVKLCLTSINDYRNDPKFSDRYAWANSADPDQTVCHSVCIVWTHYSMVESHSSNFRVITTNILGVRIFRKFTVLNYESKLKLVKEEKLQIGHLPSINNIPVALP